MSKVLSEGKGRLDGRVALIVGAASGIGAAAADLFAREGACVAIADMDFATAQRKKADVEGAGGCAWACHIDVRCAESVEKAVAGVMEQFGRLHILFNCVGGSLPEDAPVAEVDLAVWEQTMQLDARGTFLTCRYAIPEIIASGGGAVVNMASGAALRGAGKAHVYASAKGAVVSLTRTLAGTYAKDNVRANAICAGRINTERIQRLYGVPGEPIESEGVAHANAIALNYPFWFGQPEDVANVALFLASDESRMITGAAIPADGGRSSY